MTFFKNKHEVKNTSSQIPHQTNKQTNCSWQVTGPFHGETNHGSLFPCSPTISEFGSLFLLLLLFTTRVLLSWPLWGWALMMSPLSPDDRLVLAKIIIDKSHGEVSLLEQGTIENVP